MNGPKTNNHNFYSKFNFSFFHEILLTIRTSSWYQNEANLKKIWFYINESRRSKEENRIKRVQTMQWSFYFFLPLLLLFLLHCPYLQSIQLMYIFKNCRILGIFLFFSFLNKEICLRFLFIQLYFACCDFSQWRCGWGMNIEDFWGFFVDFFGVLWGFLE